MIRTGLLSIALAAVCGCTTFRPSWFPGTVPAADPQASAPSSPAQTVLPPPATREDPKTHPASQPSALDSRAMADYLRDLAKGVELQQAGQDAEARKQFEQLVQQRPTRYEAYQHLGQVCDRQKRFAEAQENYQRAILLAENREPDLFNDLGYSFFLQGKLDKAASAMCKAIALRPTEPKYHNNLGLIYGNQRRFDDAWNEFRVASAEADAYYNLAFIKASLNDFEGAKANFRRALAIDPSHERARRALRAFELAETDPDSLAQLETSNDGTQWVPYVENARDQDPSATVSPWSASAGKDPGDRSAPAAAPPNATIASRDVRIGH